MAALDLSNARYVKCLLLLKPILCRKCCEKCVFMLFMSQEFTKYACTYICDIAHCIESIDIVMHIYPNTVPSNHNVKVLTLILNVKCIYKCSAVQVS